jgi:hypothetical protein
MSHLKKGKKIGKLNMKKNYCKIKEPLSQRKYRRNPFKDVNGLRSNKMSLNSGKEKK